MLGSYGMDAIRLNKESIERMENQTLRIPHDLKEIAEKRAEDSGWSLAEELRYALEIHYQKKTAYVTMAVLEEMLRAHELKFHEVDDVVLPEVEIATEVVEIKKEEENPPKIQVLEVLSRLLARMDAGEEPTPSEIGEDLGLDCRAVGRILKPLEIEARNTSINKVAGRYYVKELLPLVQAAYAKLSLA